MSSNDSVGHDHGDGNGHNNSDTSGDNKKGNNNEGNNDGYDTRFSLPGIDDPPSTEAGVIMMGLDADRLLAGLGFAALADDSAMVTLVVDQARHGTLTGIPFEVLVDAGVARWRTARPALAEVGPDDPHVGAVRRIWARTMTALGDAGLGELGPACRAYLAACWVRRAEVDRWVEEHRGVSEVPS